MSKEISPNNSYLLLWVWRCKLKVLSLVRSFTNTCASGGQIYQQGYQRQVVSNLLYDTKSPVRQKGKLSSGLDQQGCDCWRLIMTTVQCQTFHKWGFVDAIPTRLALACTSILRDKFHQVGCYHQFTWLLVTKQLITFIEMSNLWLSISNQQ